MSEDVCSRARRFEPGCHSCEHDQATDPPPREAVVVTPRWRVVHAFNASLPGWLVMAPRRHVTALDELDDAELAELGLLQGRVSAALRRVVGCEKTYSVLFAEAEGFAHLHVHLIPRMPDQPADRRGPAVFGYLGDDDVVLEEEQDRIAREIGVLVGDL
jgi:diadenosine tetraphosphate (Ap4A) HIT family hydrolase